MAGQSSDRTADTPKKGGQVTDKGYVISDYNEDVVINENEYEEKTPEFKGRVSPSNGRGNKNIYRDVKKEELLPPPPPGW